MAENAQLRAATTGPPKPTQQMVQPLQQPQPPQSIKPKRKKKSPAEIAAAASVPAAMLASQGLPDSPPRRKNLTSSYPPIEPTRPEVAAAAAAPFRRSMRTNSPPAAEPSFRKSMRSENRNLTAVSVAGQQQQRTPPPRAALQKKQISSQMVAEPEPRVQPVQPIIANDSDSESSFKKNRRSKSTTAGKHTMRRSMRTGSEASNQRSMRDNGRNGVRSLSPVGRRPFSPPSGQRTMRMSMRGSVDNTAPTLRGSMEPTCSSSLFGRRQKSPTPVTPATGPAAIVQNIRSRSRIVDSDDDYDEPGPTKWRSRFADDSDDEPEATHFTPVRGIPRKANDSDSTDLEDSSEDEKAVVRAPPKLVIPANNEPASSAQPLSRSSEKKRGLFGIFRSKKPKEEALSPVVESPQRPINTNGNKASQLGFSSSAERDRVIEQTRARLEAAKAQEAGPPPGHAKLHRRQAPQRIMSDSWPLPPKLPESADDRPSTADGAPIRNGTTRLNQGSMRNKEVPEVVGRSGKKKRFPMLRKAFGLKD